VQNVSFMNSKGMHALGIATVERFAKQKQILGGRGSEAGLLMMFGQGTEKYSLHRYPFSTLVGFVVCGQW
jgi:hypothetical protein